MLHRIRLILACCVVISAAGWLPNASAQGNSPQKSVETALGSIFSPRRAPEKKTMGLLQRSFLDLVEESRPQLQIALVIDGTDSMASSLVGVREALGAMVDDLRRYKSGDVTFSLVVFRDAGAKSGRVSRPLGQFTADDESLREAIRNIRPESGAPYFLESVDAGIHAALTELPWSDDEAASRWILLFGDAAPYDVGFEEEETGARREYATDLLVSLAKRRDIQINCVLCESDDNYQVYRQTLPRTQQFFNQLASGSGGLMLDLSYTDIQSAIAKAGKKPRTEYQPIGPITMADVHSARTADDSNAQIVRVAVVPHMPMKQMTFDPEHPAVQVATELREKFGQMARIDVENPVRVKRRLSELTRRIDDDQQILKALADRLRVDYVIWGSVGEKLGGMQARSAIYRRGEATMLAAAEVTTPAGQVTLVAAGIETSPATALADKLVISIASRLRGSNQDRPLFRLLSDYSDKQEVRQAFVAPIARPAALSDALAGIDCLEQLLAMPAQSNKSIPLIEQSEAFLTRAAENDPKNPQIHYLLASCYFNQYQRLASAAEDEKAQAAMAKFARALKRANAHIQRTKNAGLKLEIEGDYALLVQRDVSAAVDRYRMLAGDGGPFRVADALRAHWMLAGIYSGDWGVPRDFVDTKKARDHIIAILAHWPDSKEANFFRSQLRFSEERGGTQFDHVPLEHTAFVEQIATAS